MGREGDGIKGEGRREGQGGGGKAPRERVGCIVWRDGRGRELERERDRERDGGRGGRKV